MQIEKDKVVTIHYRVSEAGGEVIENSRDSGAPMVYLHGHHGLIKGLEDALEGKQEGDKVDVTIDNAYGERQENAVQRVSINHIVRQGKGKPKLKPGMMVHLNTKSGPRPATVVKVGLKSVDVDTNHPFAGKNLVFDVEVLKVREASKEEIEHGHVHGEGGIQH